MHIRRFSPDLKTKIPGGHQGLYGVPIQFDRANLPTQNMDELSRHLNGLPILLNRPMQLTARLLDGNYLHVLEVHSINKGELCEVYYWCDVCSIRRMEKKTCECCGAPMVLKEVPLKK